MSATIVPGHSATRVPRHTSCKRKLEDRDDDGVVPCMKACKHIGDLTATDLESVGYIDDCSEVRLEVTTRSKKTASCNNGPSSLRLRQDFTNVDTVRWYKNAMIFISDKKTSNMALHKFQDFAEYLDDISFKNLWILAQRVESPQQKRVENMSWRSWAKARTKHHGLSSPASAFSQPEDDAPLSPPELMIGVPDSGSDVDIGSEAEAELGGVTQPLDEESYLPEVHLTDAVAGYYSHAA
eukprot:GFYU01005381.1.p1 GENE.GFYU01005381.1~~GFYU01005381.1.p1  ORF type:complete len:239 (+),score=74.44 GFYU01005381.1:155-871(+)